MYEQGEMDTGERGTGIKIPQVIMDEGCRHGEAGRMSGRGCVGGESQDLAADWLTEKEEIIETDTQLSGWGISNDCGPFNEREDQ